MDKKTLLAIVISVVVISLGFFLQNIIFPKPDNAVKTEVTTEAQPGSEISGESGTRTGDTAESTSFTAGLPVAVEDDAILQEIRTETDLFFVTLSTRGAGITSLKLKEHKTGDEPVEMILKNDPNQSAFLLNFGGNINKPVTDLFHVTQQGENVFTFYKDYYFPSSEDREKNGFRLSKTYTFKPGEYVFEVQVTIQSNTNEAPDLNFDGFSYGLATMPQIGPDFAKLDGRYDYRRYYTFANDKRKTLNLNKTTYQEVTDRLIWCGVSGKYFELLGVPDATLYTYAFRRTVGQNVRENSEMFFLRPVIKSSKQIDTFMFYAGPKLAKPLVRYNDAAKNRFELQDVYLDKSVDRSRILGWLESILKWILVLFYRLIPNYGVAIILLTVVIKIVLFPFTYKSYQSTSKMQGLTPKINEIKEKYKDNPQKMNQETSALYKKEGVSPLGGCLPLILQMPIFFALYGLLNSHFDLRGAKFLWWIFDLSAPESIWNFAPFKIPFLGWTDLRLLPFIFVGTQLLSSKFMQTPGAASGTGANMKLMTYLMPVVFFFILYDAPSGLILYWTVTNVLTMVQQYYTSRRKKAKDAIPPPMKIVRKLPPKKKK
ncbi:MAG: membrane protein insertase YidC [Spirochaetales bacterium]|nr:MAG: membrane protein insertase YidC [Spirochaetales bacterium]